MGKIGFVLVSLLIGQWALSELTHFSGGGLGLIAIGCGIWWLIKPVRKGFDAPSTVEGWVSRCKEVLDQFEVLEDGAPLSLDLKEQRLNELAQILDRSDPQMVGLISSFGVELPNELQIKSALQAANPLKLCRPTPLPLSEDSWIWPPTFYEPDLIIYGLSLPLRAADLLWLEQVPEDQPSWIMVLWPDLNTWTAELKTLQAQLPVRWNERVILWSDDQEKNGLMMSSVRSVLEQPSKNIEVTRQRLLARLHSSWQADLEQVRRKKFRDLQKRTQWVVAGAVFASPVPSTDLLAVAVVNGLMIKEMAKIWSCSWKVEVLEVVAKQLVAAALAQGVVEWSGQALLGLAKLHGGSWLAAGALQALSAAYLTRVVGRSMSDWMALNNGVSQPDLEALKTHASELVAKAAEQERVDWSGFTKQATEWLQKTALDKRGQSLTLEV